MWPVECCAQIGKLLLVIARHLVDEAALAVDETSWLMEQHKILAASVEETTVTLPPPVFAGTWKSGSVFMP